LATGLTPLGTRPVGPPTAGPGRYLPPVAPPSPDPIGATVLEPEQPRRSGWGWQVLFAFLAGGLVAAGGFAAAQFGSGNDDDAAVATTATTRPPVRTTIPVEIEPPDADTEPVAYVAQVLGPSVVQIEAGVGLGSGVIYDDDLVLTNNHVIEGSTEVTVTLSTGRVLAGEVIGTDLNTDLAVIRVATEVQLPKAQLAVGQRPSVGQLAVAIGSPFDLQQTVTAGVVSAVDRPVPNPESGSYVAMIQTDAPINPGNSGGALADRFGRVLGINTSIRTDGFTATNAGVGFAVPIDTAIRVADLLAAGQPIEPGFLGVIGAEPPPGELGVMLTEVTDDSAAEAAGLEIGDRILSVNGAPVTSFEELAGLVLANQAGDQIILEVIRDDATLEVEAILGNRPGS
jgi:S1-C subfamily serine protease